MTSSEVRASLETLWTPTEYVHIHEAPDSASRLGRKLDVLVLSTWASRGFLRYGVEIKVSRTDWLKELKSAEKADWWWKHCHCFYLAVPAPHAKIVRADELPPTWGLIECSTPEAAKKVKACTAREATDLPWETVVGCFRACQGVSLNIVHSRFESGRNQGFKEGIAHAEREGRETDVGKLRKRIEDFESATGISLEDDAWRSSPKVGELVAMFRGWNSPDHIVRRLRESASSLKNHVAEIAGFADAIERDLVPKGATNV